MAVPLTKEFVAAVRNAGDIVRLVSDYVPLKPAGRRLKGLCPFHHEKTASFSVDPEMQLFYCFGCQAGGDAFKFVMLYEKVEFAESVELLAKRWGVPLPRAAGKSGDDQRARHFQMNEVAVGAFRAHWSDAARGKRARGYMAKRGISDAVVERFALGYAPDSWDALGSVLRGRGFKPSEILEGGLAVARKEGTGQYDRFRDRVIFPIRDLSGRTIAFGGRAMGDAEPKYLNSPETVTYVKGENLFGLDLAKDEIRRKGFAILVEGYLDLIVLHQEGFQNAVASLGTALTPAQVKLIARYTDRVVVSYDGDAAGLRATERSLELFLDRGFDVRVAAIPDGLDPDDFVRQRGADAYEAIVRDAPGYLDFVVQRELAGRELGRPEEQVAAINAILPKLARLESPVHRAAWAGRLADALRIDDDLVMQELRNALRTAKPGIRHRTGPQSAIREAEARLVRLLIASGEARRRARSVLGPADLEGSRVAGIVRTILDLDERGQAVDGPRVVDALDRDEDRHLLTRIAFQDDLPEEPGEVDGYLEMLKHGRLKRESREVLRSLDQAGPAEAELLLGKAMKLARDMDAPFREGPH